MDYPKAVIEKAKRLEQLLKHIEQGVSLEQACRELGVKVAAGRLTVLSKKYKAGDRSWEALLDGRYGHEQKANLEIREWLYERKRHDAKATGPQLADEIEARFGVHLSSGQVNYLLRKRELTRPVGRPSSRKAEETSTEEPRSSSQSVDNAGIFVLEAAKQEMGVNEAIETGLETARQEYQATQPGTTLRIVVSETKTLWSKFDHSLYLPVMGLKRARDLYYYQGDGLCALYDFTYKYFTIEQFLGQWARLGIGTVLADQLAYCYSQAWYPGNTPLFIFSDWHVKPHWTKHFAHSGHITMWGRVMPGTKQMIINGPEGYLLGGWNYPVDAHMSKVLVDFEADLAVKLQRPIAYNIFDSEGGGLPLALRYEAAQRDYISVLPLRNPVLTDFEIGGTWQPVEDDPDHEAVDACWADAEKAANDPRRLVLMRPVGQANPTRVYGGRIPVHLSATQVPAAHRQRWHFQERRIREMINGANLNANYGYAFELVPNRTRQRQWQKAQQKVETTQCKLFEHEEAIANLQQQLDQLEKTDGEQRDQQQNTIDTCKVQLEQRQRAGKRTYRCEQRLAREERHLDKLTTSFERRKPKLLEGQSQHRTQQAELSAVLAQREANRDAIDTETLCRERNLEKDQIMLNLQVLLTSLHDWACCHYLAPEWQRLELNTAMRLIYRKSGRVTWYEDRIEVMFDSYRYADQQQAMEATCRRFNAADLHWRDGRLLRIFVAHDP